MKTSESRAKTTAAQHLAATDYRLPITIALDRAFARKLVSAGQLELWKAELRDLINEAARTFVGFQNTEALRKALEITLGLLSLAVARSTEGEEDVDRWADFVAARKLKEMVKETIAECRKIHSPEGTAYVFLFEADGAERPMKELLRSFALARDARSWTGYEVFVRAFREASQAQLADRLARWLLATLPGIRSGLTTDAHPLLEGASTASELANTILFRHCAGIGFAGRRANKEIMLKRDQIQAVRAAWEGSKTGWVKAARDRYEELWGRVPAELKPGGGNGDWFEGHLKKGPPKIPAKSALDDVIHGVTGVYFYDIFE